MEDVASMAAQRGEDPSGSPAPQNGAPAAQPPQEPAPAGRPPLTVA
jgi:hypothetical protein